MFCLRRLAAGLLVAAALAPAQTLHSLAYQPPEGYVGLPFLLTDGTVMAQGGDPSTWWKLTPDNSGSYLNGTWTQLASMPSPYAPYAFASSVLGDGRVVVMGGEYNSVNNTLDFVLQNGGAIYDPVNDAWTMLLPPAGWLYIGDSPSVVLPNGMYLIGRKLDDQLAMLDPRTLQWTRPIHSRSTLNLAPDSSAGTIGKIDFNSEEGWTLLPDGTVLTADVQAAPKTERYIPREGMWISAGSTPVDLHSPTDIVGGIAYGPGLIYNPPGEIGPAILRPDGTVFATGASDGPGPAHTAIYHPGVNLNDTGTWTAGPDFPNDDEAEDSSAVLLPSGNVLVLGNSAMLYEWDGANFTPKLTVDGGRSGSLMLLPTGETISTGSVVQLYASIGSPAPQWAPTITSYSQTVKRGSTYRIWGTQFNGLSQAASYGDENETSTNYPLVRFTNAQTGHVWYARTHDHSTMGVATGSAVVFTNFDVPAGAETGPSSLEVVANGIASAGVAVTVE